MKNNYLKQLFTALFLLCATVAAAHDFEVDGIYYNITNATNKTVEVTYSSSYLIKYTGSVVIPESVTYNGATYSVTSIGSEAFSYCSGLTSVVIGNGVTSIGEEVFSYCTGLTSIEIPNSVTSIGRSAFNGCSGLTSVVIGNGVTSIGEDVFSYCTGLTSITIPNSVTSIGEDAFYGCTGLASITIPNSVTSIGMSAFSFCTGLTSIEIPNSVTSIGHFAFDGCSGRVNLNCTTIGNWFANTSIQEVVIGDDVAKIDIRAFDMCDKLTTVVIGSGVTSVGIGAFTNCSSLEKVEINCTTIGDWFYGTPIKEVVIGNNVTSIMDGAFSNCTSLTSIEIPNSVTSITDRALYGCSNLASVVVAEGNAVYDSRNNCNAIIETSTNTLILGCKSTIIPNSVTSIGRWAFRANKGLTNITIGNSIASIGDGTFYNCSGLACITIPNSVTSITIDAFYGCKNLASIVVAEENSVYDSRNNCNAIIETSTNTLILGCKSTIIPNSVTCIGRYAFSSCTGLTSIEIPNSVKSISFDAFSYCSGLTSITSLIPAEELFTVDTSVFNGVDKATCTLYVPAGAKSKYASTDGWKGFINIVEIEAEPEVPTIGGSCGENATWTLVDGVLTIGGTGAMYDYTTSSPAPWNEYKNDIKSVVINEGVTLIGNYAFYYCTGFTSIEIPNSVTSIGNYAFFGCSGFASIEIPNSVTSIGELAFQNCTSLTSIEIPNSVKSIGDYAFRFCRGLTSIAIPNSVTSVGRDMLDGCTALTSIVVAEGNSVYDSRNNCNAIIETATNTLKLGCKSTVIPNSVTNIGNSAFSGCSGLTSVEIPNSVTSIGSYAFSGCKGLTSIEIPNSVTSIGSSAFNGCSGLTSVVIGNSVTSIGSSAFSYCYGLTSIEIPNSVTSIGDHAFSGCRGLTSIVIPNSVTRIGQSAFDGTAWYKNQPDGVVYAGKFLYEYKGTMPENTSIVIKEGTTVIADYAFYSCAALSSIEIPNSVTSIGGRAFYGCTGLTSIVIPNSVTSIGDSAFDGCAGLQRVELNCATIGDWFRDNSTIKEVVIGNSVTSIGDMAFYGCSGLTNIEIPNSVTSIGTWAFRDCTGLERVVLNCATIGNWFRDNSTIKEVVIGDSVTSIVNWAFNGCSGLTSVVIGNSVASIGSYAFNGCTGLTSITSLIPAEELFTVNTNVFGGVDKATCTLYVPAGAKEAYASTDGWKDFANIVELEPTEVVTEVTITIGQYGSTVYSSPYALDFSDVEGLKAYAATGYKTNSQIITLTRVQTAEAGIGVFLKGEPGEYIVPVIESTDEHSLNMLVATLEKTEVNSTSSDGLYANFKYTIKSGDATPLFYRFADGSALSAGKAYLQIPLAWLPATASKAINIRFDEGETTDIDELQGENCKAKTIYDLSGRAVENPASGIYIIDGKKVYVK